MFKVVETVVVVHNGMLPLFLYGRYGMISTERYLGHHARWALIARGVLSIIWGIIALVVPGIALLAFIYVFAAYALIDGIVAVIWAIQERDIAPHWIALLIEGIAGIIVGILAFAWPGETAIVLLFLVAFWAIITGILEIVTAFVARGGFGHEWLLGIAGIVSVIFGLVLLLNPIAGLLAVLWVVGIYAIVFGVLLIVRAFQSRGAAII
jgi:uncharacterized membrane protein HdeD (DUF308 family)